MIRIIILAVLAVFSWQSHALEEKNVNPGINQHYENANPAIWRDVFESNRREIFIRRHDILRALELKSGMDVADVGAGTGFFSLMFAKQVAPDGKVYAVDITENFVKDIEQRARDAGIKNITGIQNNPRSTELPKDSVDLVFICDTYHHFEYPFSTLASIRKALRDDGKLVIVDFIRKPGFSSLWVMDHVRAGSDVVIKELEALGFRFSARKDFMQSQYFLEFVKQPAVD